MEKATQVQPAPKSCQPATQEVVAVLDRHRDEIAETWSLLGLQTLFPPQVVSFPERVVRAIQFLDAMSAALCTGSYKAIDQIVSRSAFGFHAQGVDIASVLLTWVQSRAAAQHVLRRAYPDNPNLILACLDQLDHCLNYCIALYGEKHAAEMNRNLNQQHARTQWMLDMAQGVSSTLDLDEVLSYVAKTVSMALGVPNCIIAAVNEEQKLVLFRQAGALDALEVEADSEQRIPIGNIPFDELTESSLQVLKQRKPFVVNDVAHEPSLHSTQGFSQGFWLGVKSALGLPFVVNDRVVALAWVRIYAENYTFSPEDIELAEGIANVAALGIENARLHSRVKEHAIIEERERLSRELHDNLAQALGILKIRSALASEFLHAHHVERADSVLQEMQDIAAKAYTDVREAIFNLRSIEDEDAEFIPVVQRYLIHYRASFGVDVNLEVQEGAAVALSPRVSTQALRIIQEALSNVRKHAHVSTARVTVESSRDTLRVCIEDDGQGFDPAAVDQVKAHGVGLSVMLERAQSIGGQLKIESEPGQGTHITLWVPQAGKLEVE